MNNSKLSKHFVVFNQKKHPERSSERERWWLWWWWKNEKLINLKLKLKKNSLSLSYLLHKKKRKVNLTLRTPMPHRRFTRFLAHFPDRSTHLWVWLQWLTMILFLECLMESVISYNDLANYFCGKLFLIYFLDARFEHQFSRSAYEPITTSLSRRLIKVNVFFNTYILRI